MGFGIFSFKKPDANFKYTQVHSKIVAYAIDHNYAAYHEALMKWKENNGDTEDQIDIHASLLMDFIDETLSLYADSIKAFQIQGHEWAASFKHPPLDVIPYDNKLTMIENAEIQHDNNVKSKASYHH